MAIRPVDLQGAIFQQTHTAGVAKQAEDAPRLAQATAQNQFVQKLEEREETIRETDSADRNKVTADGRRQGGDYQPRERKKGQPLPEDPVGLSDYSDGEHIIDVTA